MSTMSMISSNYRSTVPHGFANPPVTSIPPTISRDRNSYVRNSDTEQVWHRGRVPAGFWDVAENRKSYMQWLGRKLGFHVPHDWYALTKRNFDENHGAGLLALKYNASPLAALQEFLPHVHWKEWLFKSAPQGFWKSPGNRRRYMRWLARELDIRQTEDWYRVSKCDFHSHNGGGFLSNVHHDSPIAAVREFESAYPWKEWLFLSVPKNFWRRPDNRFAFMNWLGEKLQLTSQQAWKTVSKQDFYVNGGGGLLANYYGDSPANAVQEYLEAQEQKPSSLRPTVAA
ncbi:hypothetical protein CA54_43770 [Symmachiella macrocystis]|uniref:Uncharacterized protein n=2 Tax=Symmachiella macrocystis TaxID=2527985 RepID=A0A5C6BBP3_9PLAN|nr:hypothetical protein CA54_43770 [Symmachiella macrocystis]